MKRNFAPVLSMWLALFFLAACGSKSNNAQLANDPAANDPQNAAASNAEGAPAPQAQPVSVLAGTPVTVRLEAPVSSTASRTGEIFNAVLDEPLLVDGQTVVARGATVRGKVTIARHSGRLRHPGELGLTLVSVSVHGQDVQRP